MSLQTDPRARWQTPTENAAAQTLVLGETTFRGKHRRFGMLARDRLRHLWVVGKTGSGKSTLLANMLAQDLASGQGLALLDPHGTLVRSVLGLVPRHRINDVLLFAPADREGPISFNVFRRGRSPHPDRALLCAQLISVFKKQWSDSWGPRLEHVLRNGVLAIAERPDASLLLLYRFLTEQSLRERMAETITDPMVRQFWTREFPGYRASLQAEALAPVLNKLGAFLSSPTVRAIVGTERSRVDIRKAMASRGILLADLATGQIGEDASSLLGGLLLSSIQIAALERTSPHPSFVVYVDEFQNFANDSLCTILAESRKYGIGLVLAHQYLAQLPIRMQQAVLGNVGSMLFFRLGATDAQVLAPELSPVFNSSDLQRLGRYEVAARLTVDGLCLDPFSARTLPEPHPPGGAEARVRAIREQSRQRYGRGLALNR